MTGALRPHHRNIYCIIYSASPLVQGERTHINLQARPLGSSLRLLFAREPTLLFALCLSVSFSPPLPSSYILWCFFFVVCFVVVIFFFLVAFQAAAQGWSISTTGPQHSCGRTLPAPSVFSLFFYYVLFFCFFFFGEQRPLFFPFEAKSAPDKISSLDSQCFLFFFILILLIIIILIAREEISEREQVLALMEQRDNAAWSSSEGELCVEHMSDIMGLIHRRKSRTPRRCSSGGRGERWVTTAASWERGREGRGAGGRHAPSTTAITTGEGGCCPAGAGANCC